MAHPDGGQGASTTGSGARRGLLSRRSLLTHAAGLLSLAGIGALAACGGTAATTGTATVGSATTSAAPATTSAAPTAASATATTASPATSSAATATTSRATSAAAAPSSSAAASSSVAVVGTKATLTFVAPSGRSEVDQAIFADFTREQPDIAVEFVAGTSSWTAVEEKVKTSIAGGTPVNIYENGWGYWADIQSSIVGFTSYLARDKMDPQKTFIPLAIDYFTQGGTLWAMPLVGISVDALAYNQDLFDATGLTYPPGDPTDASWTMETFLEYAQKLTKEDTLQFGFGGSPGGDDTGGQERPTYFGQWPWDDKAQKSMMGQPKAVEGLQFFKDLRDKYKVQPTSDQLKTIGAPKGQDVFTSGKIGMQVIYGYIPRLPFRWAIVPLPHNGGTNVSGRQYSQPLQATMTALSDQTWTLLKWLTVPAHAARLPLAAHYAVSPVIGASALAISTYKEQIGVDPTAFQQMADRSDPQVQERYLGWTEVSTWMGKNFPLFDQGKLSAADYGKAATDFINANLVK
jgi:multiple sugar transport system substrate-binding protein